MYTRDARTWCQYANHTHSLSMYFSIYPHPHAQKPTQAHTNAHTPLTPPTSIDTCVCVVVWAARWHRRDGKWAVCMALPYKNAPFAHSELSKAHKIHWKTHKRKVERGEGCVCVWCEVGGRCGCEKEGRNGENEGMGWCWKKKRMKQKKKRVRKRKGGMKKIWLDREKCGEFIYHIIFAWKQNSNEENKRKCRQTNTKPLPQHTPNLTWWNTPPDIPPSTSFRHPNPSNQSPTATSSQNKIHTDKRDQ